MHQQRIGWSKWKISVNAWKAHTRERKSISLKIIWKVLPYSLVCSADEKKYLKNCLKEAKIMTHPLLSFSPLSHSFLHCIIEWKSFNSSSPDDEICAWRKFMHQLTHSENYFHKLITERERERERKWWEIEMEIINKNIRQLPPSFCHAAKRGCKFLISNDALHETLFFLIWFMIN